MCLNVLLDYNVVRNHRKTQPTKISLLQFKTPEIIRDYPIFKWGNPVHHHICLGINSSPVNIISELLTLH